MCDPSLEMHYWYEKQFQENVLLRNCKLKDYEFVDGADAKIIVFINSKSFCPNFYVLWKFLNTNRSHCLVSLVFCSSVSLKVKLK